MTTDDNPRDEMRDYGDDEFVATREDLRAAFALDAEDEEMLRQMRGNVLREIEDAPVGKVIPFPRTARRVGVGLIAASLAWLALRTPEPAPTPSVPSPQQQALQTSSPQQPSLPTMDVPEFAASASVEPARFAARSWEQPVSHSDTVVQLVSDDSDVVIYWLIDASSENPPQDQET